MRDYALMARGADLNGHFVHYAAPDRLFSPHSLALYDRIRKDQAKALAAGAENATPLYG